MGLMEVNESVLYFDGFTADDHGIRMPVLGEIN
jgi:hypothetical protein